MPRKIIEKDKVFELCQQHFDTTGEKPASPQIYEAYGRRGSLTTIVKYVEEWNRDHAVKLTPQFPLPQLPDDVLSPVINVLQRTVAGFDEKANARILEIEKKTEATVKQITEERNYAYKQVEKLETEAEENQTEIDALKAELGKTHQMLAARDEKIGLLEKDASRHRQDSEAARAELATVRERLSHSETELEDTGKKLKETRGQNIELDKTVTSLQEKLSVAEKDIEKTHAENERLSKKLVEGETAKTELGAAQKQLHDTKEKLGKADEKLETVRRKYEEADKNAISLKAKLEAVTGERDRLTTLFETLGKNRQQDNKPNPKNRPSGELNLDG